MNEIPRLKRIDCVDLAGGMMDELSGVLLGKRRETVLLLCDLLAGGHVIIEDIPGVGKTTLASALSKSSGLTFGRVQFTPDVTASDITGYNIFNRKTGDFEFREGAVMCNILLADEINRASPKTQSSLLEAMNDGRVTVDGTAYLLPDPFMVIATQNPLGFVGTYPLPEAQLDRFALRLSLGYPEKKQEIEIAQGKSHDKTLPTVRRRADREIIAEMKRYADEVYCDDSIYEYIVDFVASTRNTKYLSLGASPRASIMLGRLAKAYAFIDGREYVLPSDVGVLLLPSLAHRVVLSREAAGSGITADEILSGIRDSLHMPVVSKRTVQSQ